MGILLTLISAGAVVTTVGASPALAAGCQTNGHVYVNGGHVKSETDPIDGPVDTVFVRRNALISLGGNGLTANRDPFWDEYRASDGGYVGTAVGNRTGDNCVSNERTFRMDLPSGVYNIKATYEPGNSGGVVRGQAHFRLVVF